jgi:Zn-dependent protease with chaperone function
MKRIFLFVVTNLAVLALLSVVLFIVERVFGVQLAGGGLLRSMSRSQAEAVLGREITHVANGDMVTLALLQGVLNTFVIFLARIIGRTQGFMRLFMSHPPLDERIAALQTLTR